MHEQTTYGTGKRQNNKSNFNIPASGTQQTYPVHRKQTRTSRQAILKDNSKD